MSKPRAQSVARDLKTMFDIRTVPYMGRLDGYTATQIADEVRITYQGPEREAHTKAEALYDALRMANYRHGLRYTAGDDRFYVTVR